MGLSYSEGILFGVDFLQVLRIVHIELLQFGSLKVERRPRKRKKKGLRNPPFSTPLPPLSMPNFNHLPLPMFRPQPHRATATLKIAGFESGTLWRVELVTSFIAWVVPCGFQKKTKTKPQIDARGVSDFEFGGNCV